MATARNFSRARRRIYEPPLIMRPPTTPATNWSAQALPVWNTPSVAIISAILPIASLREHIHIERKFALLQLI